uniref:UPF0496 protein At4g34320-like n=1 Tax=Erigeron canadensis TaxID=72917 RepID=UPI001CB8B96E|nr:UPF0496 protein At4g34320-like [Erigeron canadensis]
MSNSALNPSQLEMETILKDFAGNNDLHKDTRIQVDNDLHKDYHGFDLGTDLFSNHLKVIHPLAKDYAQLMSTIDSSASLNNCLKGIDSRFSSLYTVIDKYEAHSSDVNILEEFKKFKALDGPFSGEFFELLQHDSMKQVTMFEKLQAQKVELDKKLKSMKTGRILSNVFFWGTCSTVVIGSVVAAVVAASPLVTASAAASAVPLGSMGQWVNSLWKEYEQKFRDQREMTSEMQVGNYIVMKDLDNIKALVDKLEANTEGMLGNVDFEVTTKEQEAVGIMVDEMKSMRNVFEKTIEDLSDHLDKCTSDAKIARTMILKRIIKHPSYSSL